jgi:hypothetical protein
VRCASYGVSALLAPAAVWLAFACSGATAPGMVIVNAPHTTIAVGATVQLTATVTNATGAVISGGEIDWTSSAPTVASVSTTGLVTGLSAGPVTITATTRGVSGTIDLQVVAVPDAPPACSGEDVTTDVAVGGAVMGTLASGACVFEHGAFAHGRRLTASELTSLRMDLSSTAFVPVIVVTDTLMDVVVFDFGSGDGGNARLVQAYPVGEYYVWVTSFNVGETGSYEFSVVLVDAPTCIIEPLEVGVTVSGSLADTDCPQETWWYADPYEFNPTSAVTLQIDLTSTDFDAFLYVTDANLRFVAFDDDGGTGSDAQVVHTFPPGSYIVWASSSLDFETGDYELSVQELAGAAVADALSTPGGQRIPRRSGSPFDAPEGRR